MPSAKINNIPPAVLDALREREHDDEAIETMSPETMFSEYCEWHGLIGYGHSLFSIVTNLNKKFDRNGKMR